MALKRTRLDPTKVKRNPIVYARRMDVYFKLTPSHMREVENEDTIQRRMSIYNITRKEVTAHMRRHGHVIRRKEVRRVVTARPVPPTFKGADFGIKQGFTEWSFQKYASGALRFGCMRFSKADSLIIAKWARGAK